MSNPYRLFAVAFAVLGSFLAIWTVVMLVQLRRDPMSVIRPQWHGIVSERFAKILGIVIIIAAILGAAFAFWAAWHVLHKMRPA